MKGLFPLMLSSVLTLSLNAQSLDWVAQLGGTLPDEGYGVAIDGDGNIYTTGTFEGIADLDPGPGSTVHLSAGDADVFVTKQSPGGQLLWSIHFGGLMEDYGEAIEVDQEGNVYVTGYFNGTADFNPGSGVSSLTSAGAYDIFIAKYDPSGQFLWARRIGGAGDDQAKDISLDTAGNVTMAGYFNGTVDADPGPDMAPFTSAGGNDILVVKLNSDGDYAWAASFGDTGNDAARAMTTGSDNTILITGRFEERVDFNPGPGIANLTANGAEDAFVCKLTEDGDYIWAVHFGSADSDEGLAVHTDTAGIVYACGFFTNEADFDPGMDEALLVSAGLEDIYIVVLNEDGEYVMASPFGGPGVDKAHAIVTDTAGNIYTTGYFSGTADFDPDAGEALYTSEGGLDAFVSKLSATGQFRWLAQLGGPAADRGIDLVLGDSVRVISVGYFEGTVDFDPESTQHQLTSFGASDAYVHTLEQCYPVQLELTETACDQYISPDGLEIWTTSGTYMDTIATTAGCDTFYTIQLTILNSTSATLTETACDNYISPDGLETWTTSGIYTDTLINMAGCDSIITINLTIHYSSASEIVETACDSFISPDGLDTWTESGTYTDTLVNTVGCDSIITIQLTINYSAATELIETACDSFISPDGLDTWTESGTYFDTLTTVGGCDSIITIQLTIATSTSSSQDITACDSYTSPSGKIWATSGSYNDTIPNSSGCDSLLTINLTINNSTTGEITVSACDSYMLPGGSQTWTESGIYTDTLVNVLGCDSIVTVNLTINISPSSEVTAEACDSYTTPSGAFTWTESGTYEEVFPTGGECDSIVTYYVTIHYSTSAEITVSACETYTSPDGTEIWTVSGTYLDTIPNVAGCDSMITVLLTIELPTSSTIDVTACDGYTSPDGLETWTASGTYLDTISTVGGCDSVITVNLTLLQSTTATIDITACDDYTSPDGEDTWTTSGIYQDTIPNTAGCDSVITIHLTIVTSPSSELTVEACDEYTLPGGGTTWTTSGTYQEVFTSSGFCDSIVTVYLTIYQSTASSIEASACGSFLSPSLKYQWTESGIYLDTIPNTSGCDSIITIDLTIYQSSSSSIEASACESFLSPSLKYQWTESGIYLDTIPNTAGCDSIITIDLTIIEIDTTVTQTDHVLTAEMPDAAYQWIDCDNANQPIDGATGQVFAATANGNYAVIISSGGCSDTSSCYLVTTVSTSQIFRDELNLFPNPSKGHIVIQPGALTGDGMIRVMDSQGRIWNEQVYRGEKLVEVLIEGPSGLYLVTLSGSRYLISGKVIIE